MLSLVKDVPTEKIKIKSTAQAHRTGILDGLAGPLPLARHEGVRTPVATSMLSTYTRLSLRTTASTGGRRNTIIIELVKCCWPCPCLARAVVSTGPLPMGLVMRHPFPDLPTATVDIVLSLLASSLLIDEATQIRKGWTAKKQNPSTYQTRSLSYRGCPFYLWRVIGEGSPQVQWIRLPPQYSAQTTVSASPVHCTSSGSFAAVPPQTRRSCHGIKVPLLSQPAIVCEWENDEKQKRDNMLIVAQGSTS